MMFTVGQRVRVRDYNTWNPEQCGDPHFIIGHFGHIEAIDREYFDVRIKLGPNGGPPDRRLADLGDGDAEYDLWPMIASELEAVD